MSNWPLRELLAPLTLADFRERHWGRRAFATRIPDGALAWLRDELAGLDVRKLVRGTRGPINVWFQSLEGKQQNIASNAENALALYDAGMTIFLSDGCTPAVVKWHRAIADEAGHPPVPLTTSLFLSRRSAATPPHFDMLENITIQLSGHKRWRVAPNPAAPNALENYVMGHPVPASLERTLAGPLASEMPDDAESFDLVAGSLLYIPRGHWHTTDAALDSVSLFLGMPVLSWSDLYVEGVRAQLDRLPHWRENVWGVATAEELSRARRRFDELRAGLGADLRPLATEMMLPDFRGPLDGARALRKNPLATMQLTCADAMVTVAVNLPLGKLSRKESFTLPERHAAIFEWIAARDAFTVDEAVTAHPQVPRQAMLELLDVLQRAGLLT